MKKAIVLALFMLMYGCASVSYNPSTGEVSYTRIGDQHIQGFEAIRTENGEFTVSFEGQQSNAEALTKAIEIIGTLSVPK